MASSEPNGSSISSSRGRCASAGDLHALLHSARELQREFCGVVGEADDVEEPVDLGRACGARNAARLEREQDVPGDRPPRQQRAAVVLEHDRELGEGSSITRPSKRASPSIGRIRPAATRNSVVFPQPDGPTRQMNSSGAMSIWTSSSTAGPEPKRTPIPASEKIGVRSGTVSPRRRVAGPRASTISRPARRP